MGMQKSVDYVCRGYPIQTHYVTTLDGYMLAIHRVPTSKKDHEHNARTRLTSAPAPRLQRKRSLGGAQKPVVLLWHGFMMCSEVWVCSNDPKTSLAFTLADAGYDVWLGNTRGNKYSCKHRKYTLNSEKFWNFSIDHLAMFDLPNTVDVS